MRVDGREPDQMRPVKIIPGFTQHAEGSALIELGNTKVLCNATVDNKVPPHQKGTGKGWVTAEYSMLPRASQERKIRDAVRGHVSGRSHEIQRLIGRCLRTVVELQILGERTIIIDCDVLQADGGTRTAAITGGFVALALAFKKLLAENKLSKSPLNDYIAATSVGMVEGRPVIDLCYLEDAQAEVDMNIVMTGSGKFVEIQGTAEQKPFAVEQALALFQLAQKGIEQLVAVQKEIIQLD